MKKTFLYLAIFFCFSSLYSAEPLVKFYLNDGSTKQYNLSEIDSLGVIDKKNNYVMRIHYDDTFIAYYPTEIIGSIKFEKDSLKRMMLNVYIFSYPKPYKISSIDSLVFYIDQWQPLTIGSQVWMLKNLNVDHYRNGDTILYASDNDTWSSYSGYGVWCYYGFDKTNGEIYGKLYDGGTVKDSRALPPEGWHIPDTDEWKLLFEYTGDSTRFGFNGNLKSLGTIESGDGLWLCLDTTASNEYGFSALPGGYADRYGYFWQAGIGIFGNWWTSTKTRHFPQYIDAIQINCSDSDVDIMMADPWFGFSVRCIKNE